MEDRPVQVIDSTSNLYYEVVNAKSHIGGRCHLIAHISHKAKRISSSTSTAETLAAIIGRELAQLVAMRITELFCIGIRTPLGCQPSLPQLIELQEDAAWKLPIDQYTDCRDLFMLMVGLKGVPQDRYQRLYVLSLREDRIKGAIRYCI